MANLYKEYGHQEFTQRILGAVIDYQGEPHILNNVADLGEIVLAQKITGTPEKIQIDEVQIPMEFFENISCLKHPDLGYRAAAGGQFLSYYIKIPSAVRKGVHVGNDTLKDVVSSLTSYIQHYTNFEYRSFQSNYARALMIYRPNFTSLQKGLAQIKAGEIISFVVDNNFAVVPHTEEGKYLKILYKIREVGEIDVDGTIKFTTKWITPAWDSVMEQIRKRQE